MNDNLTYITYKQGTGAIEISPAGQIRLTCPLPAQSFNLIGITERIGFGGPTNIGGFQNYTYTVNMIFDALFSHLPNGSNGGKCFITVMGYFTFVVGNDGVIVNGTPRSDIIIPMGVPVELKFKMTGANTYVTNDQGMMEIWRDGIYLGAFPFTQSMANNAIEILLTGQSAPTEVHVDNIKIESFGEFIGTNPSNTRTIFRAESFTTIENISMSLDALYKSVFEAKTVTEVVTLGILSLIDTFELLNVIEDFQGIIIIPIPLVFDEVTPITDVFINAELFRTFTTELFNNLDSWGIVGSSATIDPAGQARLLATAPTGDILVNNGLGNITNVLLFWNFEAKLRIKFDSLAPTSEYPNAFCHITLLGSIILGLWTDKVDIGSGADVRVADWLPTLGVWYDLKFKIITSRQAGIGGPIHGETHFYVDDVLKGIGPFIYRGDGGADFRNKANGATNVETHIDYFWLYTLGNPNEDVIYRKDVIVITENVTLSVV